MYSTTDWNGHRKYKSDHRFCEKWPLLHKRINHQKLLCATFGKIVWKKCEAISHQTGSKLKYETKKEMLDKRF